VQAAVGEVVVGAEVGGEAGGVHAGDDGGQVQLLLRGDALGDESRFDTVPGFDHRQIVVAGRGHAQEEGDQVLTQGAGGAGVLDVHSFAVVCTGGVPGVAVHRSLADVGQVVVDREGSRGGRQQGLHGFVACESVQAGDEGDAHGALLPEG